MKLLISTLTELGDLDLPDGVEAVWIDEAQRVPEEHRDAEGIVCWGTNPDLAGFFADLPRLGWIQTYLAGPDKIMALDLPDHVVITNGAHFHDLTVAEHALGLTLALLRGLPACARAQQEHRWASELGGVQPMRPRDAVTTLIGTNAVVWGFGGIGQAIGRLLAAFGANVTGIATTAGERAGFPVTDDVDAALAGAEVLIMVLPHRVDTIKALNERTLGLLPARAVVVNVGRGSGVDEDALVAALSTGRLAGAGLDVTSTEPLPADSPLWEAPNLIITPHSAGGRPVGAEQRIAHNVRAYLGDGDYIGQMPR